MNAKLIVLLVVVFLLAIIVPIAAEEKAAIEPAKGALEAQIQKKVEGEVLFNRITVTKASWYPIYRIFINGESQVLSDLPKEIRFPYDKKTKRFQGYEYWVFQPYDPSRSGNLFVFPEREVYVKSKPRVTITAEDCMCSHGADLIGETFWSRMTLDQKKQAIARKQMEMDVSMEKAHKKILQDTDKAKKTLEQPLPILTRMFSAGLPSDGKWTKISEEELKKLVEQHKNWLAENERRKEPEMSSVK